MKAKILLPYILLLMFLAGGCRVYSVLYTDRDEAIDFSQYKTFAWLPDEDTENAPYHNQIIESNTRNYFSHEFMARRMTVDVNAPDVLLQLVVKAADKQRTEQVPVYNTNPQNQFNNPYAYPNNNSYSYNPYNYQSTSPLNPYYTPNTNQNFYNRPPDYNYNFAPTQYTTQTINYTESTITLNVIDRQSNKIVFTSVVGADLYDPSEMRNNVHTAVHSLLDSYPVMPFAPDSRRKKNK